MQFTETNYAGDVQILKRGSFEGIAMTLDFSDVEGGVVKAGTPIGSTGVADNTGTVVGILLHDVSEARPQGTLLKKAYINRSVAEAHADIEYDDAVIAALPMVIFE